MVKINKKVEYALIVLQHLQRQKPGSFVTARTICDRYFTPFDTTSKVMQVMNQKNILKSQQGTKGGYQLFIDLAEINYLQLVEMIEGKVIKKDCIEQNCSLVATCNISGPITKLNNVLFNYFKTLSLKDLLSETPGAQVDIKEAIL